MATETGERRLAAIMFTDIVGYTALMGHDEAAGLRARERHRSLLGAQAGRYHGEVVDENGDELVLCFPSAVEAVNCALAAQAELADDPELQLRIGIHLGDVVFEGGRVYGDGVNVASRVRPHAEPGGVCVSDPVYDSVRNQLNVEATSLGEQEFKNVARPVEVFALRGNAAAPAVVTTHSGGKRLRLILAWAGTAIVLVAFGLWASWPRPLAFVLEQAGLLGVPENPQLPDQPSIVVLPFDNMSGDPEQEYFADGLTEDLTTDLSRHPQLFVIARNSAFTYKGRAVRIEDVGRELGVRYAVEGSIRKAGDEVRITAQLIDATSGLHVWSERYDRELVDIFELQDEIVTAILDSVGVEIMTSEHERARRKPTEDLSAYDAFMRGQHHLGPLTRRGTAEARRWFAHAIDLDPGYAEAQAALGLTYQLDYIKAWNLDPGLLDRAEEHARRCFELDPSISLCHASLAGAEIARGSVADAIRHAERAIELAPSHFLGHLYLGLARIRGGQPLLAIPSIRRAIRLNPRGDEFTGSLAAANYWVGREREAIEMLERSRAANPDVIGVRLFLANHYEAAGDHAQARVLVEEVRAVNPDLTVEQIGDLAAGGGVGPEDVSTVQENLRKAGLFDHVEAPPDAAAPHTYVPPTERLSSARARSIPRSKGCVVGDPPGRPRRIRLG